ncbi:RNA methyltransferase [Flavobacteriales bacterium]|nr:RNA methyltransferase [Flavobacteriales bacterium]
MVTKNEIKFIKSLTSKRVRNKLKLFVVEGEKSISEFLKSDYKVYKIYSIHPSTFNLPGKVVEISDKQLSQISSFKSPNKHLAVFEQVEVSLKNKNIYFILDNVNDPGNLGTIIRTIDWFGYNQLICSKNSVDCYNSKVIQSTMGSLARVDVHYIDLIKFLKKSQLPIYGTSSKGTSIYKFSGNKKIGIWIFGSEANGISDDILKFVNERYTIPKFDTKTMTESLNLSTSFSVVVSFLRFH